MYFCSAAKIKIIFETTKKKVEICFTLPLLRAGERDSPGGDRPDRPQ